MNGDLELLDRFATHQRDRNLSETNTVTKYAELHHAWVQWLHHNTRTLTSAGPADVAAFLASRRLGPDSRYQYLSRLSSLYRWLIAEGECVSDPTARIARPRVDRRLPRPIGGPDLRAAMAAAGPMLRAWLTLGALQGFRCKEIAGLRVEDLVLDGDPLLVVSCPKGHRQRSVPLHPDVVAALDAYGLPRSGFVFLNGGVRFTPYQVSRVGNRFLRTVGVAATMHQLRHWFGTSTYRATKDLLLVQNLLGHASPVTTAVYAAFAPAGGDAVRALSIG